MAEKMIAQNSIADAVAAVERLIDNYGDAGGFIRCNYLIGQAKENKDFQSAALNYETASNSSGMKMRMTLA